MKQSNVLTHYEVYSEDEVSYSEDELPVEGDDGFDDRISNFEFENNSKC